MKLPEGCNLKKMIAALVIGGVVTLSMSAYSNRVESALAGSVIRLHVLANSNSAADQELKLKVRDRILAEMGECFSHTARLEQARDMVCENMDEIARIAREEVMANGYDYPVTVSLGTSDFPTKAYGNVTLPAGTYEALKVEIGESAGQNWWCVLFPPLCFVDATTAELPEESRRILEDSLGEEGYALVTQSDELPVEVRFKAYELWQSGKMRLKAVLTRLGMMETV